MAIRDLKNKIVIENKFVKLELSKKDASVLAVTDARTGESIMGEKTLFFELQVMVGEDLTGPHDAVNGVSSNAPYL